MRRFIFTGRLKTNGKNCQLSRKIGWWQFFPDYRGLLPWSAFPINLGESQRLTGSLKKLMQSSCLT
jgi:hypothetical protein